MFRNSLCYLLSDSFFVSALISGVVILFTNGVMAIRNFSRGICDRLTIDKGYLPILNFSAFAILFFSIVF